MYIRSHDGLEIKELPVSYGTPGLSDGLEKETGISPELVYKLADLVFFSRYPNLLGTRIKGNRSLELEYNKIYKQLLNPSSSALPTSFEINLNVPQDNPQPDYSKTVADLGVWEAAIFNSKLFRFSTEKTVMSDGKPGSYVSWLSVKFDNPKFTVFIAKHLWEKSHDSTMETRDRNPWGQILLLVRNHAYVHLDIYRRAAKNMEKVLQELFSRLLPLPTAKKPLAVAKDQLDEYLIRLGEFITAIINLEFWEKTCAWEKKDYPELSKKIQSVQGVDPVITRLELKVKCGSKPKLPNIPLPPISIKAIGMYIRTSGLRGKAITSQERRWPIGNLGQAARGASKFDQCWEPQKNAIQAAFMNALRSVNHATAVLGSAYGRPDRMTPTIRYLLNRHFHTTDRGNVLKILRNVFRIGQALKNGLNFECETNCERGSRRPCGYAWATQWFGGRGDIHICFDNRPGFCSFANLNARDQAALIIHEAAHRHVGIGDKAYLWERTPPDPRDYTRLTPKQAMDNADSYAWFSVMLLPGL
jgi:hypothetical protein